MSSEPGPRANGAAIKAIRKKDRKTAADVARYARIETQSLYNIEDGQRNASPEKLQRIADILGVPLAAITCQCAHDAASDERETVAAA